MMYYLFPTDYQFQPLEFKTLSELDTYCRDNSICVCLINENADRTKFLCNRWNKKYFKGMYKNTFVGF